MRQLRLLFTLITTCLAVMASAADFQIEGFIYTVTDEVEHAVSLTGWDEDFYSSISSPTNPNIGYEDEDVIEGPVDVVIPWRVLYDGIYYRVTGIGKGALANCETLSSVTIPNSVDSIGEQAFAFCENLKMVKVQWINPLPIVENVFEGIDYDAATLYVLSGYKEVYQVADVWKNFGTINTYYDVDVNMWFKDPHAKAICVANWDTNGDGELSYREAQAVTDLAAAFMGDTQVTSFTELRSFSGLATIEAGTFKGCTALTEVTLAPYATSIGQEAFAGCTALQTVKFQSPLITIEDYAFAGCTALPQISLPANLTTIGAYAFANCTSLPQVTFPANLTTIGAHAFDGCTSIPSFTITAKVNYIGEGAFANCTSNKTFTVNSKNTVYDHNSTKVYITDRAERRKVVAFAVGAANRNLSFSATVNEICPCAMEGDRNIVSVNLENIQTVGSEAFANCPLLTVLWIPSCVTSIGQKICDNSDAITDVYSDNLAPFDISDDCFTATVYANALLHVPEEAWELYTQLEGWRNFAHITRPQNVYGDNLTINPGETAQLVINLMSDEDKQYTDYEFELVLPEGVQLIPQGNSFEYELSERNPSGMVAAFDTEDNVRYLVVATSIFGRPITGTDGPLITLTLQAAEDAKPGVYSCQINHFKLSGSEMDDIVLPDTTVEITVYGEVVFDLGDVNHDGKVNITDVMLTVDYVLGIENDTFNIMEADVNNNGHIDITDVMSIVALVLDGKLPDTGGDDPNTGGGDDPNTGGGDDPNTGGGDDPNTGGGDDPNTGGGDDPNTGGGDDPNTGGGDDPNTGGGDDPNTGGGDDPNTGGGDDPNTGGGDDPNTGGGDDPNTGGGDDPNTGGGDDPNTGGGDDPNTGGGDDPNTGGDN